MSWDSSFYLLHLSCAFKLALSFCIKAFDIHSQRVPSCYDALETDIMM